MKYLKSLTVLAGIVCLLSCNSKSPEEINGEVNSINENCPIDHKGVGKIAHVECDTEEKILKIDFTLNNEYINVEGLDAIKEEGKVVAGVDIVNSVSNSIDWAKEGYDVELSIYDDVSEEEMKSSKKWSHKYTSDYLNAAKKDITFKMSYTYDMAQLIGFYYAKNVLAKQLPHETSGPWIVDKISTEWDYLDIYYKCTEAGADDSGYFNIFMVEGEDDQKMLGGGSHYDLTRMEMTDAFRNGKTVLVGGEPLFALDFLYKCEVPARYHFEPLSVSITFRDHKSY